MKKLEGCIKINFNKVRTNKTKLSESDRLHNKMQVLKTKEDKQSKEELKDVIEAIAKETEKKY